MGIGDDADIGDLGWRRLAVCCGTVGVVYDVHNDGGRDEVAGQAAGW